MDFVDSVWKLQTVGRYWVAAQYQNRVVKKPLDNKKPNLI